jgi:hypothetical protein
MPHGGISPGAHLPPGTKANCACSVEPFRAVVEDLPPEMIWATSSK